MTINIDTLAQAARHGMLLRVQCRRCERTADYLASEVIQFQPGSRRIENIRFHCRECDNRDFKLEPIIYDRDRSHEAIIWRPVRMKW